ncbi:MAG: DUF4435 domain-containing protein [Muribaculaceae bacterium]|nr:DUF4435 domain-containing protein [Muribaculaceae bacterium]
MLLPPRSDGSRLTLSDSTRQVLIIGANGAGKSRFASRMLADVDPAQVFPLSPLAALFGKYDPAAPPATIDGQFSAAVRSSAFVGSMPESAAPATQFERLMSLMLLEEVVNLMRFKVEAGGRGSLPETMLDRVLELWQEIFPDNGVLRSGGELLFTNGEGSASRPGVKLSAGEKLVLYYFGAVLHAPAGAVVAVESPGLFLHPSTIRLVWDKVEALRPDCRFIYVTHDLDFASTRSAATTVWVRGCAPDGSAYDYDLLPPDTQLSEEMYMTILGARRPVMFIEGDDSRSIDSKLYPLIFPEYTVKALGSCDRVIESTRVFNSLGAFHHLDSCGIVDRDRRSPQEVEYLRRKKIMVPEVAEIENLLMLEDVVRTVAEVHRRDPDKAFHKVRAAVMAMFRADLHQQALLHTRHAVKRTVEHRIDGRFANISKLEEHMADLVDAINPRMIYDGFCREFHGYLDSGDYASVLRVYNQKSMLPQSNVSSLTGTGDKQGYITAILHILKAGGPQAARLRSAIRAALGLEA